MVENHNDNNQIPKVHNNLTIVLQFQNKIKYYTVQKWFIILLNENPTGQFSYPHKNQNFLTKLKYKKYIAFILTLPI